MGTLQSNVNVTSVSLAVKLMLLCFLIKRRFFGDSFMLAAYHKTALYDIAICGLVFLRSL